MATRGRPRKSTEQHKLDGTYQECRHGNNADVLISTILSVPKKIEVPEKIKNLKNKTIETLFKKHVDMLISLKSIYEVDIPELIHLYLILNDIYKLREAMDEVDLNKNFFLYEKMQKLFLKQISSFNVLGSKFYLTPQVRAQMRLNDLQELNETLKLEEKLKAAEKNPVQKLINKKKN